MQASPIMSVNFSCLICFHQLMDWVNKVNLNKCDFNSVRLVAELSLRTNWHTTRCAWLALDVLHVICTQLRPGHLSLCVGDSSWNKKIIEHLELRISVLFFGGGGGGGLRSPAISLGFTTFGWDFCVCDRFFNPTIKVVTFRLRGWCVLGVFLLPAFTRLGHERQDLLSSCDEMHVCTG